MKLLEAIMEANRRAGAGDAKAGVRPDEFADALPLVALTCIDARLNRLLPEVLGIPEEKFIWLRNSGNIIFDPMSSMTRTLAMACAIKGGREIAVIGHTDCLVCKTTTMQLLERFKALGVERQALPDNLNEFFGLFSSERQNVITACDIIRRSPLVGPKVPVHGLLLDIVSGKLEWLVNGYETLGVAVRAPAPASAFSDSLTAVLNKTESTLGHMQDFKLGDMKFPETKIGEAVTQVEQVLQKIGEVVTAHSQATTPKELAVEVAKDFVRHIVKTKLYKVIGDDKRQYGPISGEKLLQWVTEERIDPKTPVQIEGSSEWAPLEKLGEMIRRPAIPLPPPLVPKMGFSVKRPGRR